MENISIPISEKSSPADPAKIAAQVPSSQAVAPETAKQTAKEKYGRQWLYRLSTLPPVVYEGAIARLIRGDTSTSVARWLMFFEFLDNPEERVVQEVHDQDHGGPGHSLAARAGG